VELTKELEAYIEATVNRAVAKALDKPRGEAPEIRPEAWDFQVAPANQYPGHGWIYMATCVPQPGRVDFIWRKSRLEIAQQSGTPIMPVPPK
jgi:hypothetical protein